MVDKSARVMGKCAQAVGKCTRAIVPNMLEYDKLFFGNS